MPVPNPPIPGHHLLNEGHSFPIWGDGWEKATLKGHDGGCECGEKPPDFPNLSANKMKVWHRQHKAELRGDPMRLDRTMLMRRVLDDAESALRMGDFEHMHKVIFVWSQRKEHLLAGEESWDDNFPHLDPDL